jgi:hypothetical protein
MEEMEVWVVMEETEVWVVMEVTVVSGETGA